MSGPISVVAIVGAGYMGKGIASCLARAVERVVLVDQDAGRAERAVADLVADVRAGERDGLIEEGYHETVAARTTWAPDIASGVSGADYVAEVVPESIPAKLPVLRAIEESAPREAVIATNTSSIPVADLAVALRHPSRFFGVHWFNPAPYVPGVEVIVGKDSDESYLPAIMSMLRAADHYPERVSDAPGFVCNRLQFALFREAALMVEEGLATPNQIDTVVRNSFGFRLPIFGPFAIADMAGLDVYAGSFAVLAAAYGDRFSVPASLQERVDGGDYGTKSGGGYTGIASADLPAMAAHRNRSYVALARLRAELEERSGLSL